MMKFINSINQALHQLLSTDSKVILYGEDISDPYGGAFKATKGLSTEFPNRVISTPISEAAMIGIAGGISIGGLKPIVEIMFGDFLTLGMDQLLNHLVKYQWMYDEKVKVAVTIRAAMGGRRGYGPTHSQSLEPLLASIPQLNIYSPSIYHDPGELLKQIVSSNEGITIFSENKLNYPKKLINEDNIKKGLELRRSENDGQTVYISNMEFEDPELLIISHGGNASIIEELMIELLMDYELSVQANFPARIKPLNYNEILLGLNNCKGIITFEESPKSFGWGSEIIAYLVENGLAGKKNIMRIGAEEFPIPSSSKLETDVLPGKGDINSFLKSVGII